MDQGLFSHEFSKHFNNLAYLGLWPVEEQMTPFVKKLFFLCRAVLLSIFFAGLSVEIVDFYLVFGNFRKVTFNLSTSVIVVGYPIKILLMLTKRKSLNELRLSLWKDSFRLTSEEEIALKNQTHQKLKRIRYSFYYGYSLFVPAAAIISYFSYLWGPRELPFPAYYPLPDPMNDLYFIPGLLFEVACGFYVVFMVTEGEFAMYSLILQMNLFYDVLICHIEKLSLIYDDEENRCRKNEFQREINFFLKKEKAKTLLRNCVKRHLELIEYAKKFEYVYSTSMFFQLFAGTLLTIMNCFELSVYLRELNARFCFQMGFITGIGVDFVFFCFYLTKLSCQCHDVGKAAYSTYWYKMDTEIRKILLIIITCSKKAPRITAGKLYQIDMTILLYAARTSSSTTRVICCHCFSWLVRVSYSWVMLMRQVMVK